MATYTYTGSFKQHLLMDQLIAAGIGPVGLRVEGLPDGSEVYISPPDSIAKSAVDAVVALHNSSVLTQREQTEADASGARSDLAIELDSAITYFANSLADWAATDKDLFLRRAGRAVLLILRIIRGRWF